MATVCLIPARFASTRLPGKVLADILGRPMVVRVLEAAQKSGLFDDIAVATDHPEVAQAVLKAGGRAVMTSAAHASGADRIAEAARAMKLQPDDLVVNLQGDEPLVTRDILAALVGPMQKDPAIEIGTLAYPIKDPEEAQAPDVVKVVRDSKGFALYFSRLPIPFHRDRGQEPGHLKHLGIYAYRLDALNLLTRLDPSPLETAEGLEQLRFLEAGKRIRVFLSPEDTFGVDTADDLEMVRDIISRR